MQGYLEIDRYLYLASVALRNEDQGDKVSAIRLMCRNLHKEIDSVWECDSNNSAA